VSDTDYRELAQWLREGSHGYVGCPKAADAIDAQAREIQRLRAALENYQRWCTCRGFGAGECGATISDEYAATVSHKAGCMALAAREALAKGE